MEPTYFSGLRVKVQKSIIVSKSVIHTKTTATQQDLKYHPTPAAAPYLKLKNIYIYQRSFLNSIFTGFRSVKTSSSYKTITISGTISQIFVLQFFEVPSFSFKIKRNAQIAYARTDSLKYLTWTIFNKTSQKTSYTNELTYKWKNVLKILSSTCKRETRPIESNAFLAIFPPCPLS